MRVFQQNPSKVFPFDVGNCTSFYAGAECLLINASGVDVHPGDTGWVGVNTTSTSVTFTVIENGYFDAPGSVIEFSTWVDANGTLYLRQTANGQGVSAIDSFVVNLGVAHSAWKEQASKLDTLLASS